MFWWLGIACNGAPVEAPTPTPAAVTPAAGSPTAQVFPSGRDVPENGLRFRLLWSEEMQLGPHAIEVRDAHGRTVPGAVREIAWEEGFRAVSIRPEGLKPTAQFALHVEGVTSARGIVNTPFDHVFVLRPPDTTAPSAKAVTVVGGPVPGGHEPLVFTFPEPMDVDGVGAITVLSGGEIVTGRWTFSEGEAVWTFDPDGAWPKGAVRVSLGAGIRDLAGNELVDREVGMFLPSRPRASAPASPAPATPAQ